jgi:hypothetical protein
MKQNQLNDATTPRSVDQQQACSAFLVAKMADGSRWKLPIEKLLESMADRWQEYWEDEGKSGTRKEAMEEAWLELKQHAASKEGLQDDMTFDGVSAWDDWKDLAERLPDERPDPADMWADAEIVLCQPNS